MQKLAWIKAVLLVNFYLNMTDKIRLILSIDTIEKRYK